ncbi:MAG TPA: rod-binding protein [Nitrospiria bacterium]|nr:rod-binding protein [Nitrospiria bacterium]
MSDRNLMIHGLSLESAAITTPGMSGPRSLRQPGTAGAPAEVESRRLQDAARAFEAYFLSYMMKEMRKTIPQGGAFGNGPGQEVYQSLFDEALGQAMAQNGGIGLSKLVIQQYLKKDQSSPKGFIQINR